MQPKNIDEDWVSVTRRLNAEEGTETGQDGPTIEENLMGNGTADADGGAAEDMKAGMASDLQQIPLNEWAKMSKAQRKRFYRNQKKTNGGKEKM